MAATRRGGEQALRTLIVEPTLALLRLEAAGGLALVVAAAAALVWVNVDAASYRTVWGTRLVLDVDVLRIEKPLDKWVTDALMVVFFFVVGLEIKREAILGELADRRQALLPVAAALGGMAAPVVVFVVLAGGGGGAEGWGIPVATDIAFALGVLALLGRRVPVGLTVFLLALAVVDDLGGILIIALFYTDTIDPGWLVAGAGLLTVIVLMNRLGVRAIPAYLVVGAFFWLATFESGVHATIAGVALGLLTPVRPLYDPHDLQARLSASLGDLRQAHEEGDPHARAARAAEAIRRIERDGRESRSPLERLEYALAPWAAFGVVPVFALANGGIELNAATLEAAFASDVAWGVAIGLVGGKLIGILGACAVMVRLNRATLPASWGQMVGVSLLAGIGFTVAIFIADLAYEEAELLQEAKTGILLASVVAALAGYAVLRLATRRAAAG